jgi:hypothetical protein
MSRGAIRLSVILMLVMGAGVLAVSLALSGARAQAAGVDLGANLGTTTVQLTGQVFSVVCFHQEGFKGYMAGIVSPTHPAIAVITTDPALGSLLQSGLDRGRQTTVWCYQYSKAPNLLGATSNAPGGTYLVYRAQVTDLSLLTNP